jgi:hypothetical protein
LFTEFGLPRELTIYCYNDITVEFTGSAAPLAAIWDRDLGRGYKMGDMPGEWARFWHLADEEYNQGGGWICVEERTGRLVEIDLDCPDPVHLFSASVPKFYTLLAYFLDWTEKTDGSSLAEMVRLRAALLGQDRIPAQELEPFWMNLIDATIDSATSNPGLERLGVRFGTKNA